MTAICHLTKKWCDCETVCKAEMESVEQFSRPELAHLVTELQTALNNIREITGDTHRERPYTALSLIDQIARKALAI